MQLRARAALRARLGAGAELPLLRLIGQHAQLFGVLRATPPIDPSDRPRVYVGDAGERRDGLPYEPPPPIEPGRVYNEVTVGAVVPTVLALLPGAAPVRFSVPAPLGLPRRLPGRARRRAGRARPARRRDARRGGRVQRAAAAGPRRARRPGRRRRHVADAAAAAVADVAPWLAEPLHPDAVPERRARLHRLIAGEG